MAEPESQSPQSQNTVARPRPRWEWRLALVTPMILGPVWALCGHGLGDRVPAYFGSWSGMVLVLLAAVATYTDLRWRRIPNWATYSAAAWGLGINLVAAFAPDFARDNQFGAVGLANSLGGFTLLFVATLIIFSFTGGGGGDVKLAAAFGMLLGVQQGLNAVLYAMVAAGVGVLVWSVWNAGPLAVSRAIGRRVGHVVLPLWIAPPAQAEASLLRSLVPLGPFFAVGAAMVLAEVAPENWLLP